MNRTELKETAKQQMKGNMSTLIICTVIVSLLLSAVSSTVIGTLLYGIGMLALANIFLGMTYGKTPNVEDLFNNSSLFPKAILLGIVIGIFVFLWSLLFIIPGIIKGISYSQAFYILLENPDMSTFECISASKELMSGHKAEYFVLMLSFIGWYLLGFATCAIAFIYVQPYLETVKANYYRYLISAPQVSY